MSMFKAALIQTNSGDDMEANIAQIAVMMDQARAQKAQLICLPENAFYMCQEGTAQGEIYTMQAHPGVVFCCDYAKAHQLHIVIGSIRAKADNISQNTANEKTYNRQVWINDRGDILGYYDKIHLFDVAFAGGKEYQESKQFLAGDKACMLDVAGLGKFGLSICYDLRFAHLYQHLARAGAEILLAPAAFTRTTGKAHWEILLRARAIENGAYMLAAAQCGTHPGGRSTYGHAMMIDPWGKILAQAGETPEVIIAEIDLEQGQKTRQQIPVLAHHRAFSG
jgi:predicted amidohydrolase